MLCLLLAGCGSGVDFPAATQALEAPPRLAVNATSLSLKAGWNAVAFKGTPLVILNAPPAIIGLAWCINGTYQTTRFSAEELNRLGSSQGYWVYSNSAANLTYTPADVIQNRLVLVPGWNLVSFPAPSPIPFYALDVRRSTFPVPASQVLLRTFLQVNPDGTTKPVDISGTRTLSPGFPYWVYALDDISLEYALPAPTPSPTPR